ncbi:Calcium influx-promoting protein ehs1 [Exophiala dermatitidis]
MPFLPKLTPLQSRFVASLAASIVLLAVYLFLTQPRFAYAVELDSRMPRDGHEHYLIIEEEEDGSMTDAVHGQDKIELSARAEAGVSALANNDPQNMNIDIGETQYWVFPATAIAGPHGTVGSGLPSKKLKARDADVEYHELTKRQNTTTVYITINTCLQPASNTTSNDTSNSIPPQLQMYVSTSPSIQKPGPGTGDIIDVDGGYAIFATFGDSDVYVGISGPNTTEFSGIWNYEIAASIDAPYHGSMSNATNLHFVDSDNHAALLITDDTTQAQSNETVYQEWMDLSPPWGVFAANQNDTAILGVKNSFCGLKNAAKIAANVPGFESQNVAKMTNRGLGGKPKEQFYITGLNATSKYWGFLVMNGNSTASGNGVVGGGGTVWQAITFETKTEDNCALMYNLSFCSEVAYAVPTNPQKFPPTTGLPELAALYDSYASQMYQYFNYSLQQIPCNTTSSAQYSLARNCDDCARAYKQWLCAVTIPRCADYSNDQDSWLKPRNVGQPFVNGSSITLSSGSNVDQVLLNSVATNSSRNPIIDESIRPGPYKEVLPCKDLCYDLVQSCPAKLGFACPLEGAGLEDSYGSRSVDSGVISCSYLGAAYYLSGTDRIVPVAIGKAVMIAFGFALWNLF